MQDIGPDMEQLLYRASEEYPLKDPPDKWQVIQEAVNEHQASMRKNRYMNIFLSAGLLTLLMTIGLTVGDGKRMTGVGLVAVQQVPKHIEKISIEPNDSYNQSIVRQKNVASANKMPFVGPPEPKSAIPPNTHISATAVRTIKLSDVKSSVTNINSAEGISGLISMDIKNVNRDVSNST